MFGVMELVLVGRTDVSRGSRIADFRPFCKAGSGGEWCLTRSAEGLALEREAVGVVTQPIERCRGERAIGREGLIPFGEVEVAGDDGGRGLVTFGDEVVQVLVGGRTQGLEAEVINDQQRHAGEVGELALVAPGGARRVQAGGERGAGKESDVNTLAYGGVAKCLREMALAGAAGPDDDGRGVLVDVAPGGEVVNERSVQARESIEVELLEGPGGAELRAPK